MARRRYRVRTVPREVLLVWTTRGLIRLRICPLCTAVTVAPDRHAATHRAERERP